jgi:KDO2-lipid IV(A) lauroyltransferase
MIHALQFAVFLLLTLPVAVLPYRAAVCTGEIFGLVLHRFWRSRRRIAVANVRGAVERGSLEVPGSPDVVVRENFRFMGRYAADIVKVFYGLGEHVIRSIRFTGLDHFQRAHGRGAGVILVSGHCGNWELMALALSLHIGTVHGVARRQSNPLVDRFIVRARERYGSRIVYKRGALRAFLSVLKQGGTVGVLMDQAVLPEEGVLVDFLGAPAWTTRLPVTVARRTGAALVPVFLRLTPEGYECTLQSEIPLSGGDADDTQRLVAPIEDFIRRNPEQWLWIHRRWKRAPTSTTAAAETPE